MQESTEKWTFVEKITAWILTLEKINRTSSLDKPIPVKPIEFSDLLGEVLSSNNRDWLQ